MIKFAKTKNTPSAAARIQALALLCLLVTGAAAWAAEEPADQAATPETAADQASDIQKAQAFSLADVENMAQALAEKPFVPADSKKTALLNSITEQEWNSISFNSEQNLWRDEHLPFEVGFFPPGFIFDQPVVIMVVDENGVRELPYEPQMFNYPAAELRDKAGNPDLGFAGFRLKFPLNNADRKDEVVSFLGATHFRGLPRHARYGLEARSLILNPAHPSGEEFPYFRRFWLVKPEPDAASMTVYALLDSPSLTGAYQFIITPGSSTVMEVSAKLFRRAGANFPEKIGLAPLGSMYLFSEKEGSCTDWRPEVHNSDILLWADADQNWFRRPLSNPDRLELNSYSLKNPVGFGLMQQDNDFNNYQDIAARFDLRPSLWVEPKGDWGPGSLELIEIPASQQIHSNILSFWTPETIPDQELSFAYKLYWMPPGTIPHQIGRAVATRYTAHDAGHRFIIDFESGALNDIPAEAGLASIVETFPEIPVTSKNLIKNPVTGGWRLDFRVKLPENGVIDALKQVRGDRRSVRIQTRLKKGENLAETLTETWVYDLPY